MPLFVLGVGALTEGIILSARACSFRISAQRSHELRTPFVCSCWIGCRGKCKDCGIGHLPIIATKTILKRLLMQR